jgi:hypothetical protein
MGKQPIMFNHRSYVVIPAEDTAGMTFFLLPALIADIQERKLCHNEQDRRDADDGFRFHIHYFKYLTGLKLNCIAYQSKKAWHTCINVCQA